MLQRSFIFLLLKATHPSPPTSCLPPGWSFNIENSVLYLIPGEQSKTCGTLLAFPGFFTILQDTKECVQHRHNCNFHLWEEQKWTYCKITLTPISAFTKYIHRKNIYSAPYLLVNLKGASSVLVSPGISTYYFLFLEQVVKVSHMFPGIVAPQGKVHGVSRWSL